MAYGRKVYHRSFFIKFLYACIRRRVPTYLIYVIGVETLVYNNQSPAYEMAVNINRELERVGFINLGVNERPNLVVLNRTQMPAVLVEVGFINTDNDNELYDRRFMEIAWAIAQGIVRTFYPGWDIYPI